jgi:hypothetical protein
MLQIAVKIAFENIIITKIVVMIYLKKTNFNIVNRRALKKRMPIE